MFYLFTKRQKTIVSLFSHPASKHLLPDDDPPQLEDLQQSYIISGEFDAYSTIYANNNKTWDRNFKKSTYHS